MPGITCRYWRRCLLGFFAFNLEGTNRNLDRLDVEPTALTQGDGPTTLTVLGEGFWPHHQVYVAGKPLETSFVSREELRAVLPASAVAEAGMYKVTVRSIGEPNPESFPAPLVVGFR